MNHHHAAIIQQSPPLTLFERVEKPKTLAGVRLLP
jgi:hypothetical protein